MRLTVAICTWNRAALLRQALDQMSRLAIPPEVEWELLIVNNNSTDDTDIVINSFASRLPIRRLFEAKPGLSNARNLAVREATGQYILWTDDDVLVDKNWVEAYSRAFQRWPLAVFFGGPATPWFPVSPPKWLQRAYPYYGSAWGLRDFGKHPIRFDGDQVPYGLNWAVRGEEQRAYQYDPRFGAGPGRHVGGEETHIIRRMIADGYEGWWVPEARVLHYTPPERMKTSYLRRVYFGYGTYLGLTDPVSSCVRLFGRPRWAWRSALTAEAKYWVRRLISKPEVWVGDLIEASTSWGYLSSVARR